MVIIPYISLPSLPIVLCARGFMKYPRESMLYRPAEKRMRDWDEIYNSSGVRRGLRAQAARCMECGVPFCQGAHGCPLGNIIPKWNDLIYRADWPQALRQLLQTNNFPGNILPKLNSCLAIDNLQLNKGDYTFQHNSNDDFF